MGDLIQFLSPLVGICFLVVGRHFKDYAIGVLGSIILFVWGISVILEPLNGVHALANLALGFCAFGAGGYVFTRASMELLNGDRNE